MGRQHEFVWCADPDEKFVQAEVLDTAVDGTLTVRLPSHETRQISHADANFVHSSANECLPDLLDLVNLDYESLLHTIRERYYNKQIYTSIGSTVVISVNPYKFLPELYSDKTIKEYRKGLNGSKSPHIYAAAEQAYVSLMESSKPQSIIITGESGAGKTEATKKILQYLASVQHPHLAEGVQPKSCCKESIEHQVLRSNPVLEAFGNAKTVRNDNSSRFGKFIAIMFEKKTGRLSSALIASYLLERSRIVRPQEEERNYHIFYQLVRGLPLINKALAKKLFLLNPETDLAFKPREFRILATCEDAEGEDDIENFNATMSALKELKFPETTIEEMLTVLAAILHLGEVDFELSSHGSETAGVKNSSSSCRVTNDTRHFLEKAATCLNMDANSLEGCLTTGRLPDSNNFITVRYDIAKSVMNIEALSKALYGRMFSWIVTRINDAVRGGNTGGGGGHMDSMMDSPSAVTRRQGTGTRTLMIGLLDIYGFEVMGINSIEQLCINFANERLQRQFNEHFFGEEQRIYAEERINWEQLGYTDNQPIINAIGGDGHSIFSLCDAQSIITFGNEKGFFKSIDNTYFNLPKDTIKDKSTPVTTNTRTTPGSVATDFKARRELENSRIITKSPPHMINCFAVRHYAGPVNYSVSGFVEKNKNSLHLDVYSAVSQSASPLVSELFGPFDIDAEAASLGRLTGSESPINPAGLAPRSHSQNFRTPIANRSRDQSAPNVSFTTGAAPPMPSKTGPTVLQTFRAQLNQLIDALNATQPRYVRCIKPNAFKQPFVFDAVDSFRQLECAGVLEAVKIRREGFAIRLGFQEFVTRYRRLIFSVDRRGKKLKSSSSERRESQGQMTEQLRIALSKQQNKTLSDYKSDAQKVLEFVRDSPEANDILPELRANLKSGHFQLGVSRIFLKESTHRLLEQAWVLTAGVHAETIQRVWRRYASRMHFKLSLQKMKAARLTLQSTIKTYLTRKRFLNALETKRLEEQALKLKLLEAEQQQQQQQQQQQGGVVGKIITVMDSNNNPDYLMHQPQMRSSIHDGSPSSSAALMYARVSPPALAPGVPDSFGFDAYGNFIGVESSSYSGLGRMNVNKSGGEGIHSECERERQKLKLEKEQMELVIERLRAERKALDEELRGAKDQVVELKVRHAELEDDLQSTKEELSKFASGGGTNTPPVKSIIGIQTHPVNHLISDTDETPATDRRSSVSPGRKGADLTVDLLREHYEGQLRLKDNELITLRGSMAQKSRAFEELQDKIGQLHYEWANADAGHKNTYSVLQGQKLENARLESELVSVRLALDQLQATFDVSKQDFTAQQADWSSFRARIDIERGEILHKLKQSESDTRKNNADVQKVLNATKDLIMNTPYHDITLFTQNVLQREEDTTPSSLSGWSTVIAAIHNHFVNAVRDAKNFQSERQFRMELEGRIKELEMESGASNRILKDFGEKISSEHHVRDFYRNLLERAVRMINFLKQFADRSIQTQKQTLHSFVNFFSAHNKELLDMYKQEHPFKVQLAFTAVEGQAEVDKIDKSLVNSLIRCGSADLTQTVPSTMAFLMQQPAVQELVKLYHPLLSADLRCFGNMDNVPTTSRMMTSSASQSFLHSIPSRANFHAQNSIPVAPSLSGNMSARSVVTPLNFTGPSGLMNTMNNYNVAPPRFTNQAPLNSNSNNAFASVPSSSMNNGTVATPRLHHLNTSSNVSIGANGGVSLTPRGSPAVNSGYLNSQQPVLGHVIPSRQSFASSNILIQQQQQQQQQHYHR